MMNKYDANSIEWAVRNHPRRLYYRPTGETNADGTQALQVVKGRQVNPETSMSTGGTVVRGRSRKGKFRRTNFLTVNAKSDARIDPEPVRPAPINSGFAIAYVHDGNRRVGRHVPLRSR